MALTLLRNLIAGFRLVTALPVRLGAFTVRTDQLILLLCLLIGLRVFGASIPHWPVTGIWPYGLGILLLKVTLLLALLQAISALFGQWRQGVVLQVMVLSGTLLADLAWLVTANSLEWRSLPLYAGFLVPTFFLGFTGIAVMRSVRLTFSTPWLHALACGAVVCAALLLVSMKIEGAPIFKTA